MGGPFRAIVGGAKQVMSFAPAQAIQLDNYSTQYGHLINGDVFVAPGQIGMVVLVDGISAEQFEFAAPPGASQAAPTVGQICLIRTFDEAAGPGAPPPLAPGVGVLLPIGLDSPQHFHNHSALHHHFIGSHLHTVSGLHDHVIGSHAHVVEYTVSATSGPSAGTAHTHSYNDVSGTGIIGPNTDPTSLGNTGLRSPGSTDNTSLGSTADAGPGASDLENVQHTHP